MLKVMDKVVSNKYENVFTVEIEATFPKSKGKAIVEMGGFEQGSDERALIDLIETCSRLINAYPNGRTDMDAYDHIDGYEDWFAQDSLTDDEKARLPLIQQLRGVEWLADPNGAPGSRATFHAFNIFFYDENGQKFTAGLDNTGFNMKPVNSSMISEIGYDNATQTLKVVFKSNNSAYEYDGVPSIIYKEFMDSHSLGRYFRANIRDKYNTRRLS